MNLNRTIFIVSFLLAFVLAATEYGPLEAFVITFVTVIVIGTSIALIQYIGEQLRNGGKDDFDL